MFDQQLLYTEFIWFCRIHIKTLDGHDIMNLRQIDFFNSTFKDAIHIRGDLLWQASMLSEGRLIERMIKERFALTMFGFQFPRNHKFFEIFDRKIQEIFAAGLTYKLDSIMLSWTKPECYKEFRHKYENDDPKVLSLKELEAGFVIWLIFMCSSVIVFVLECISRKIMLKIHRQFETALIA